MRTVVNPRLPAMLATLMQARGMLIRPLAARAHVSHSYICEVLNGRKMPSLDVARALDDALDGCGELAVLADPGVNDDDADRFAALTANPCSVSAAAIPAMARTLADLRDLDDRIGSANVTRQAATTMDTIVTLAREATGGDRAAVIAHAGEWAQFSGWLATSTGKWEQARHWFHTAQEWAIEADDADLLATATSYLAHVAWLTAQPGVAVGLSKAALRDPDVYVGQRAYDGYQLARSYAACGDLSASLAALHLADDLAAAADAYDGPRPAYQYYRSPWFWALERGLALRYIARHDRSHLPRAVANLRRGLDGMPEDLKASDWSAEYMTVGLASAYLDAGDLDEARRVLDHARGVATAARSDRVLALIKGRERRLQMVG